MKQEIEDKDKLLVSSLSSLSLSLLALILYYTYFFICNAIY